jgi:hypothetical protein
VARSASDGPCDRVTTCSLLSGAIGVLLATRPTDLILRLQPLGVSSLRSGHALRAPRGPRRGPVMVVRCQQRASRHRLISITSADKRA